MWPRCSWLALASFIAAASVGGVTFSKTRRDSMLIHPGTKWCGVGTLAMNHSSLGSAFEADKCCREHDYCKKVIQAKETRYSFTSKFHFTISHCECDVKFYYCLKNSKDAQGSSVLDWFFRFVRMPCFELVRRRVCKQKQHTASPKSPTECSLYGEEEVAELRRLPFFADDLAKMRLDKGRVRFA